MKLRRKETTETATETSLAIILIQILTKRAC